ncbi:hypothetical protein FACS1894187_24920 [Synergistales bacterium]|nr:hypothetical protein FACS1894187_24920 [Synergistales bacterium]
MIKAKKPNRSQYKQNLSFLFITITLSIAFLPIWSGIMIYNTAGTARQILVLMDDERAANVNYGTVKKYSTTVEKIDTTLKELKNIAYSSRELQSEVAEELLVSGISVDSFSVKPVINKARGIPITVNIDWNNFNFSTVSLIGTINKDKVADLVTFLGTREKIWHISSFEMRPLDTPTEYVLRYNKMVEEMAAQSRSTERDAQLDMINKRASQNTLAVSLTFLVPVRIGDD